MARISVEEARKSAQKPVTTERKNTNWLKLPNDGDTARVRFLLKNIDGLQCEYVHMLAVEGKNKTITLAHECLDKGNGEECPICQAGYQRTVKVYVPLLINNEIFIWSRGAMYINEIQTLFMTYEELYKYEFDLIRSGKSGDMGTIYRVNYYPACKQVEWDSLPDPTEALNNVVIKKPFEDYVYFAENGKFKPYASSAKEEETTTQQSGFKALKKRAEEY